MEMAKAMEINVNDHDTHARISKSKFYEQLKMGLHGKPKLKYKVLMQA